MKVTFRTVTGTGFSLDLEDSSKVSHHALPVTVIEAREICGVIEVDACQVLAVKEKVRETKGDAFPAANQVLIFQGKVGQLTMSARVDRRNFHFCNSINE